MSRPHVPVPLNYDASTGSFAYQIPESDQSMSNQSGVSFPPGTTLIIDPARKVLPGDYVLVAVHGYADPVLRRYQASRPFDPENPTVPYTLVALNPSFEPITINHQGDASIKGRMVAVIQRF